MRMKKKKYLTERLEAVSEYLYTSVSEDRNFKTAIHDKDYIDFLNSVIINYEQIVIPGLENIDKAFPRNTKKPTRIFG